MTTSTNLRSSFSFPNLLLSFLNFLLFFLSSASFAPLLLLRTPPTSFGWALFAVSSATLLSSLLGYYSHLTNHRQLFFIAHISLLVISSIGQALGFLSLFLQPDPSLRLLGSERSPGEVRVLTRIEEWVMVGMFTVGSAVLVLECAVQSWWVREYEEVEAARKRGRRMARVQVESVAEAEEAAEAKGREMDERMKSKCEQWAKNEFEA